MPEAERLRLFLSHNAADKEYVRRLAAATTATGAHVWFDEWTIRPGDSIPGAIDQGLANLDIFALVWSEAASKSRWVKTEMEAAVTRWTSGTSVRLIPIVLDRTPLPTLLRSLRYIDGIDRDQVRVTRELLGIDSEAAFRRAVQLFIDEAGLQFREFWGVGVMVACPKCGASPDKLQGWQSYDDRRDDRYAGARCTVCEWEDGSEM